MGDRISISFKTGEMESVTLFNHWGGKSFVETVEEYLNDLGQELKEGDKMYPLQRREPNTVMVDFIRWLTLRGEFDSSYTGKRVMSSYYLGKDESDGDNSDNGHVCFILKEGKAEYTKKW